MQVTFLRPTKEHAGSIAAWTYPPPYDFYNWDQRDDPDLMTQPSAGCYAALDDAGALVGFACFGAGGQVPGGVASGAYELPGLDIGLGLRPDLTGTGLGLAFVEAVIAEARKLLQPHVVRLTVAEFNVRARRVYERAGFRTVGTCFSPVRGEDVRFVVMTRGIDTDLLSTR